MNDDRTPHAASAHDERHDAGGDDRLRVRILIRERTLQGAARALRTAREPLARYVAELPVKRGTELQIVEGLRSYEAEHGPILGEPR
jgi:hypothetical protein